MKKSTAQVSIIISTQSCEDAVDALCLSLFCQNEKDMQIIFVDNDSTDNTLKLLKKYAEFDNRIEVYKHKCNNLLDACYFGLKKATAPYTLLLNGTQNIVLVQNCVYSMLENMTQYRSDMLYTSCCIITPAYDKLPLYQISAQNFKTAVGKELFCASDISASLLFNLHLCPWGKMYKTEFLKSLTPEQHEVAFFLKCLFNATKISYILDNLYLQKTGQEKLWQPDTFAEIKNCEQILLQYGQFEKYKNAFIGYKLHRIIEIFNNAAAEYKSPIFEQMKAELFAIDYSRYDPNVLQKIGITSLLLKLIGLNYEQYIALYAEKENG